MPASCGALLLAGAERVVERMVGTDERRAGARHRQVIGAGGTVRVVQQQGKAGGVAASAFPIAAVAMQIGQR